MQVEEARSPKITAQPNELLRTPCMIDSIDDIIVYMDSLVYVSDIRDNRKNSSSTWRNMLITVTHTGITTITIRLAVVLLSLAYS